MSRMSILEDLEYTLFILNEETDLNQKISTYQNSFDVRIF